MITGSKRNIYTIIFLIISLLILALILFDQLITPPLIGLADSGDFYRLSLKFGIYHLYENQALNQFYYITKLFKLDKPLFTDYNSSQGIFVWSGLTLNNIFRKDNLFDIRYLAFIHIITLLISSAIFINSFRRLSLIQFISGTIIFIFILSDTGHFSYFNSLYSEPSSLIFLILTLGILMNIPERCNKYYYPVNILFFLSSILFITSKPQNSTLFPFILFLWWWVEGSKLWKEGNAKKNNYANKLFTVVSILILVTISIWYFTVRPFKEYNLFNNVFLNILGHSQNIDKSLHDLNLAQDFKPLAGKSIWGIENNEQLLAIKAIQKLSYKVILAYYLRNPIDFFNLLERVSKESFTFRPSLGNFESSQGYYKITQNSIEKLKLNTEKLTLLNKFINKRYTAEELILKLTDEGFQRDEIREVLDVSFLEGVEPRGESKTFSHLSYLKKYCPEHIWSLSIFFIFLFSVSIMSLYKAKNSFEITLTKISLCLLLMAGIQFLTVALGEGIDLIKQMYLFNIMIDFSVLINIVLIIGLGMEYLKNRI